MLKIWLIRHGMTEGNRYQRYIGVTDEPLCEEGRELLGKFTYPKPQAVFVSPLKRCLETATILLVIRKSGLLTSLQNVISENLKIKIIKNFPVIHAIRHG